VIRDTGGPARVSKLGRIDQGFFVVPEYGTPGAAIGMHCLDISDMRPEFFPTRPRQMGGDRGQNWLTKILDITVLQMVSR